jgi:multidrug efflux pump subunit AcrA (membrane-fusion protein)
VRAAGRIEIDERRVHTVSAKFEGWIERLHVNATGQPVARGQALFEVYSPELVSAQREYAVAAKGVASAQGRQRRDAIRHETAGRIQPGAPAQLGHLRRADQGPGEPAASQSAR